MFIPEGEKPIMFVLFNKGLTTTGPLCVLYYYRNVRRICIVPHNYCEQYHNNQSVQMEPNGPLVPFVHSQGFSGPCK